MSDDLRARAERAAAAIIAEHGLGSLGVSYDLLVAVIAVGWLDGWQDGGDEAQALIRGTLARLSAPVLHSVKP